MRSAEKAAAGALPRPSAAPPPAAAFTELTGLAGLPILLQVGLAVAAVLLGVVFIVASGGSDLGYAMRRPGGSAASQQQQGQQLSDEVKADLEKQLGEAEAKLQVGWWDGARLEMQLLILPCQACHCLAVGRLTMPLPLLL